MFTYLDLGKNESAYFKRILFELILYMVFLSLITM